MKEIKEVVKKKYSDIANKSGSCCSSSCCDSAQVARAIGYSKEELDNLPENVILGLGCGNPTALAGIKEGETVLDLGSGSGIDVFLAAKKVGRRGYVIGVDMTQDMIDKARKIAADYDNVEFRLGEIEKLPVDNASIDVIISNCVINLSPDKLQTFKEAYRALKPGGRLFVSDIVLNGELPEHIKNDRGLWSACIAGAIDKNKYLATIKEAGFKQVSVVSTVPYKYENDFYGKIMSVQVKAYK